MYITNAIITKVDVEIEDHGFLTMSIWVSYGNSSGQCFGGYYLYNDYKWNKNAGGPNYAGRFIHQALRIAGVNSVSAMAGKAIRVEKEDEWGFITAIGHITEDLWFKPKEEFA